MTLRRGFAEGEYYHIYNRGAHKDNIFLNDIDRKRFLFSILYYQAPIPFENIKRIVEGYRQDSGFPVNNRKLEVVLENRAVELVCFCLMPNHFHLIVREVLPGGISAYMQRVQVAHTKYMNTKYEMSGHVFEDRFNSVHIKDNNQLLYLSAYIHRNPRELRQWKDKEFVYPWSSLQDYTEVNRWGGLLASDIIAEQFELTENSNYKDFVETSTSKILKDEIPELI